ncbi:SDR family NAD(P)-dependent oxidoreductase [Collimonas silvisoli]|uniref:SDR family NAD(P)-dependent oxidoreductase n=1 Tax=Collimonas silvisoli TaxID=2825884 RepID=UPI001E30EEC7|nr:SDR family oxidoreductase [Collimonas silvisoli]
MDQNPTPAHWLHDTMPLSDYFSLKGKVAVVTGAARGIAAHTAHLLAAAGAQVAVLDTLEQEGRAIVRSMSSNQAQARFWRLDVGDEVAVRRVFCEIEAHFGRIDILINSAGVDGVDLPVQALTPGEWERAMQVDSYGTLLCTMQVVDAMERAGGGAIVNLSSLCCIFNEHEAREFNISISAIRRMTRIDAVQYGGRNIRVNSVHPGFIRTPMLEAAVSQLGNLEVLLSGLASFNPMRQIGSTGDIAAGILYLASDASRFVTGTELVIDGGYICRNFG